MGWNSWDGYGTTITEAQFRANARWMAQHLKPFGWKYVTVDMEWFVANHGRGQFQDFFGTVSTRTAATRLRRTVFLRLQTGRVQAASGVRSFTDCDGHCRWHVLDPADGICRRQVSQHRVGLCGPAFFLHRDRTVFLLWIRTSQCDKVNQILSLASWMRGMKPIPSWRKALIDYRQRVGGGSQKEEPMHHSRSVLIDWV
jgi:hypothetical protein